MIVTAIAPNGNYPNPKLKFEAQGHLVKVLWSVGSLTAKPIQSTRGAVTEFSRKSRKRLLELCARLDLAQQTANRVVTFVTLTYGQKFPDAATAKNHLRALLERFRRLAPDASAIWRLEYQQRGAPHFHLICFNLPFIPYTELASMWGQIVDLEYWDTSKALPRPPMTRIEAIRNPRMAMAYVSKYVAKHEDSAAGSGFNDVPYLHAGRFWGVFNREKLPFAELITMTLQASAASIDILLFQFKRLMAKKWKRANKFGRLRGAAIFVDVARSWHDAFLWCLVEYYAPHNEP